MHVSIEVPEISCLRCKLTVPAQATGLRPVGDAWKAISTRAPDGWTPVSGDESFLCSDCSDAWARCFADFIEGKPMATGGNGVTPHQPRYIHAAPASSSKVTTQIAQQPITAVTPSMIAKTPMPASLEEAPKEIEFPPPPTDRKARRAYELEKKRVQFEQQQMRQRGPVMRIGIPVVGEDKSLTFKPQPCAPVVVGPQRMSSIPVAAAPVPVSQQTPPINTTPVRVDGIPMEPSPVRRIDTIVPSKR